MRVDAGHRRRFVGLRSRLLRTAVAMPLVSACGDERSPNTPDPTTLVPESDDVAPLFIGVPLDLRLGTDAERDLVFPIEGFAADVRVMRDARDVTLELYPPFAERTATSLTLHLAGAMLPGSHSLFLQGREASLVSQTVRIEIEAGDSTQLRVRHPLADLGRADRLLDGGGAEGGALGLVSRAGSEDRVVVYPPRAEGWARDPVRFDVAVLGSGSSQWAVGAQGPDLEDVWVAWTEGEPPRKLSWRSADGTEASIDAFADVSEPYEAARLGALVGLGDRLLFERGVWADVEAPRPGERTVFEVRLRRSGARLDAPRPLAFLAHDDASAPRAAIDLGGWRWLGRPSALVHRRYLGPTLLGFSEGAPRVLPMPTPRPGLEDVTLDAVILGSFGSRILVGHSPVDDSWLYLVDDDAVGRRPDPHRLGIDPATRPHCVATQLHGVPILLFAGGPDAPTLAVIANRVDPTPFEIPSLLCDALVVRASVAADRAGQASVACLSRGRATLGALYLGEGGADPPSRE